MTVDERAERFRALYEAARPRVIAYALRRTDSAEDAADVVAEAFTIAWRKLDTLPGGGADLLWLYATARRVHANQVRRQRRHDELVARIAGQLGPLLASRVEHGNDEALAARLALSRLGDDDREILMLAGWEGLSSDQLAVVLSCSPTAARIRLHRARARLSTVMAEAGMEKQESIRGHRPVRDAVACAPEEG